MENKMQIQVLGSGCPTCKTLFEQTKQAVSELKLDIAVEYSNDIQKMIELGAMSSPLLVINNKIALAGQVPGVERIKEILTNNNSIKSESTSGCSCGSC
ncbi:MAG: thioredoxin family protein [Patescibacteria group bacterium]|jgi:small redox-active disulfide protein 2